MGKSKQLYSSELEPTPLASSTQSAVPDSKKSKESISFFIQIYEFLKKAAPVFSGISFVVLVFGILSALLNFLPRLVSFGIIQFALFLLLIFLVLFIPSKKNSSNSEPISKTRGIIIFLLCLIITGESVVMVYSVPFSINFLNFLWFGNSPVITTITMTPSLSQTPSLNLSQNPSPTISATNTVTITSTLIAAQIATQTPSQIPSQTPTQTPTQPSPTTTQLSTSLPQTSSPCEISVGIWKVQNKLYEGEKKRLSDSFGEIKEITKDKTYEIKNIDVLFIPSRWACQNDEAQDALEQAILNEGVGLFINPPFEIETPTPKSCYQYFYYKASLLPFSPRFAHLENQNLFTNLFVDTDHKILLGVNPSELPIPRISIDNYMEHGGEVYYQRVFGAKSQQNDKIIKSTILLGNEENGEDDNSQKHGRIIISLADINYVNKESPEKIFSKTLLENSIRWLAKCY